MQRLGHPHLHYLRPMALFKTFVRVLHDPNQIWNRPPPRALLSTKLFQKVCAFGGILCPLLFFLSWIASGFVPPMPANYSGEQVLDHYRRHETGIKFGSDLMLIGSMFYATFTAAISAQMIRIPNVPYLASSMQMASGSFACVTFLMPAMFFGVTAFRLDRPVELTLLMNDMSWITMVQPWPPFLTQNWAFAWAIWTDQREKPLFPKWLAWFNFIAPPVFAPSLGLIFTKTGPFAWHGVLSIWIPAILFLIQFIVNVIYLFVAIDSDPANHCPEDVLAQSQSDSSSNGSRKC